MTRSEKISRIGNVAKRIPRISMHTGVVISARRAIGSAMLAGRRVFVKKSGSATASAITGGFRNARLKLMWRTSPVMHAEPTVQQSNPIARKNIAESADASG